MLKTLTSSCQEMVTALLLCFQRECANGGPLLPRKRYPVNRQEGVTLSSSFPYHSFQYVEISGFPNHLNTSVALYGLDYSQEHISTQFFTDNKVLNQLYVNIASSQAANFLSIPTNSPSKDARLGWLEPAGICSLSLMYLSGNPETFRKWLRDIRESQASTGAFPNVAPRAVDENDASPGSGTASIIITYNLYRMYGDIRTVEENYESNRRWLKFVRGSNPNFLYKRNTGENEGDIGNVNAETPKEVIATAYYAYGSLLMSYLSKALNKTADHEFYVSLHRNISNAFVEAYVNESDGKIEGDTQSGYVVALEFKIVPEKLIPKMVQNLVDDIIAHEYHVTTGYLGTAHLLSVLVDHGHTDIAYKLLLQNTFPSWFYMIENGATNIWERWDSRSQEKQFSNSSLNSLALGSVGSFLIQYIAGIDTDDEAVGFRRIIIKPHIGSGLEQVSGRFFSNYGSIFSSWRLQKPYFEIEVEIPPNSKGKLILPFINEKWETELSSGINKFKIRLD